ncbi:MAG: NAD-dependent epimerase/dehydratase family protein [Phycisphaerae bacterium]|nr:NAD-dependent epimerase/dehydratase family protein [Phycisphaerae bacterium]
MNALITGGAGFIGSHLAEKLLNRGYKVTAIDDLSTGSMVNIKHLLERPDFDFVMDTVRNEQIMHLLIEKADVVYHLAAAVGVRLIVEQPVRTIETNIHGSEMALGIANKFRRPIFIASTSEVYGKSDNIPFREDDDTVLGSTRFSRWAYACSKAIDEFLGLAYYYQFRLPVVIGRFFNTVGPRQTGQYGMVVPRFVERALRNEPIEIHGDGKQTRCFCHVDDVTDAVVKLMETPDAAGQVYNIGSDQEISIEDLADRIIEMAGSSSTKKFITYQEAFGRPFDDMLRRVPCLEKVRRKIGYAPRHDLQSIIDSVIASMKQA